MESVLRAQVAVERISGELRSEITRTLSDAKSDLLKWAIGIVLIIVIAVVGAGAWVYEVLKGSLATSRQVEALDDRLSDIEREPATMNGTGDQDAPVSAAQSED